MEEEKRKAWARGIGTGVAWMAGAALEAWLCSASALLDLSWRKEERRGRGKRIGFRKWIRLARAEGEVRRRSTRGVASGVAGCGMGGGTGTVKHSNRV